MKDQAKKLLSRGLPQSVVANAIGCTESYISQLMADESFAAEVNAARIASIEKDAGRDDVLNEIEDALALKLSKSLAFIIKPQDITRTLQVVNQLKRRDAGINANLQQQSQIVNVNLPAIIMQNFIRNQQGEITEVDGRSMATLSPAALTNMLSSQKGNNNGKGNQLSSLQTINPAAEAHQLEAKAA